MYNFNSFQLYLFWCSHKIQFVFNNAVICIACMLGISPMSFRKLPVDVLWALSIFPQAADAFFPQALPLFLFSPSANPAVVVYLGLNCLVQ